MIQLKRAYEPADAADGHRVLVERLWPRGLRKEEAHFDEWLKTVAPSDALRKWFHHDPDRWLEFRRRYAHELREPEARATVDALARRAKREVLTLVYAAHDAEHNSALVLAGEIARRSRGQARSVERDDARRPRRSSRARSTKRSGADAPRTNG